MSKQEICNKAITHTHRETQHRITHTHREAKQHKIGDFA